MASRARAPHTVRTEKRNLTRALHNDSPRPLEEDRSRPMEAIIRLRAHELYLQRGGEHGHDVEDWLQAESELLTRDVESGAD